MHVLALCAASVNSVLVEQSATIFSSPSAPRRAPGSTLGRQVFMAKVSVCAEAAKSVIAQSNCSSLSEPLGGQIYCALKPFSRGWWVSKVKPQDGVWM